MSNIWLFKWLGASYLLLSRYAACHKNIPPGVLIDGTGQSGMRGGSSWTNVHTYLTDYHRTALLNSLLSKSPVHATWNCSYKRRMQWSSVDVDAANATWAHNGSPLALIVRDGNGYPKPETWWVKTLLGHGYGGFWYPWVFYWVICYAHRVRWAWVCYLLPHTRYPMGNPLIYDTWVWIQILSIVYWTIRFEGVILSIVL
jgi:hypothetical protein